MKAKTAKATTVEAKTTIKITDRNNRKQLTGAKWWGWARTLSRLEQHELFGCSID